MEATALSLAKSVLSGTVATAKSVILEEVALQLGVQKDLAFISDEFEMVQSFVLAAHEEQGEKKVVRTWAKQVRELGYDVEDCLEDFAIHLENPSRWRFLCTLIKRRSIAKEIKDLKVRVEDVSQRNLRYRLIEDPSSKPASAAEKQISNSAAIFGHRAGATKRDMEKLDLADLITNDKTDLQVIAVWGSSSDTIGKIWTIRKVYDDRKVTRKFLYRAWVKLVHPFNPDEFLQSIVRQFYGNSAAHLIASPSGQETAADSEIAGAPHDLGDEFLKHVSLKKKFDRHVNKQRYLIVIEGLSTMTEWDWIKQYLDNKNGSRIMVSTQQMDLASLCVGHQNQVSEHILSPDHSLYIFFPAEDITIIIQLISQGGEKREVISVWGEDAPQKTTLVTSMSHELTGCFHRRAFVTVSHPLDPEVLINNLVIELSANSAAKMETGNILTNGDGNVEENLETLGAEDSIQKLAKLLKGQKYLIVLDGISTTTEWDSILPYLPADEENGSRIVLTTTKESVATYCSVERRNTYKLEAVKSDGEVGSSNEKGPAHIGPDSTRAKLNGEPSPSSSSNLGIINQMKTIPQESQLIGRRDDTEKVFNEICEEDSPRRVICVWGTAGVGKTALVESIYQSPNIIKKFQIRVWTTVEQPFNLKEFLRGLASELSTTNEITLDEIIKGRGSKTYLKMGITDLYRMVKGFLDEKKYLIILDGVSSKNELCMIMKQLPVDTMNGSRIIVTAREEKVAMHSMCTHQHNLRCLSSMDALSLFKTKVHEEVKNNVESDIEMMDQAKRIIEKCDGLPLAIVNICASLASRPATAIEWRKMSDHIGAELDMNPSLHEINKMIILSYKGLPFDLKSYFLYTSIFPKGYNIRRRRLVRRWVAEGYSLEKHNLAADDIGEGQFTNLSSRGMIQLSSTSGKASFCRVNNLMHEISMSKSKEENLICLLDDSGTNLKSRDKVRHLVVSSTWNRDKKNALKRIMDLSRVRSLTVFGKWRRCLISSKMRVLRVLDLEDTEGLRDKDIEPIGKLRHLRYLSLRGSQGIFHIPESFGNLSNLETLDVRGTLVTKVTSAIVRLQKLSYLRAGFKPLKEEGTSIGIQKFLVIMFMLMFHKLCACTSMGATDAESKGAMKNIGPLLGFIASVLLRGLDPFGVKVPRSMGEWKNMHTLGVVNVARGETVIQELKNMTKLRKLGVSGINKKNGKDLSNAISDLSYLESLSLRTGEENIPKGNTRSERKAVPKEKNTPSEEVTGSEENTRSKMDCSSEITRSQGSYCLDVILKRKDSFGNSELQTDLYVCLEGLVPPPRNLQSLKLYGNLKKLPQWMSDDQLKNLTKLNLRSTRLEYKQAMDFLEKLPKLVMLRLWRDSLVTEDGKIVFQSRSGAFATLTVLEISEHNDLVSVEFEKGAMAMLEVLQIVGCDNLGRVHGLSDLRSIKEVQLKGAFYENFKKNLRKQAAKFKLIIQDL